MHKDGKVELTSPSGHSAHYTDHDNITLSEASTGRETTHQLYHSPEDNAATFDCLHVDFHRSDERMLVLEAALEVMNKELYGTNSNPRELLLKASSLLKKGSKSERLEFAKLIDQYLKEE